MLDRSYSRVIARLSRLEIDGDPHAYGHDALISVDVSMIVKVFDSKGEITSEIGLVGAAGSRVCCPRAKTRDLTLLHLMDHMIEITWGKLSVICCKDSFDSLHILLDSSPFFFLVSSLECMASSFVKV